MHMHMQNYISLWYCWVSLAVNEDNHFLPQNLLWWFNIQIQIVFPNNYICLYLLVKWFIFLITTLSFFLTKREGFHLIDFFFFAHSSAVEVLLIHFQPTKNKENVLYRKSPLYVMHWRWHCSNNFTLWMIRYACVCYWDIVIFFYLFSTANMKPKVTSMQHHPTLLL